MACSFDFSDIMEGGHVLLECVDEGSIEKVRSLLESQLCNVDETDQSGRTALHLAALRGKTDLANVLILGGADVNFRDKQGNTPLHWCGSIDTIELLVDSGASLYLRNKMGLTPKELAYRRGVAPEVLDLLAHFESQTNNHDSRDQMVTRVSVLTSAANASDRLSSITSEQVNITRHRQAVGFWQELSCELGVQNTLLCLLGLLGFSFYVAYILTGMHQGIQVRIPVQEADI
ncbi:ankyrin repeat domain-containing protein 46-like [Pomacea canaliculata]|uniref:ankyrin repeat domain-containing protein 46-like n=1 Tax=Pomacea canaliculata TaxID=400727 RepID=UPI000D73EA82|nr:ankyrin repeat domain-containing protein 46-like [Pomacea canaliculata]